jgi:phospholipid-translocating ATPase
MLFSTCHVSYFKLVHLSFRVSLDMGKAVYAHLIMNDVEIPNTIVRTSTLPEELGRITYLLSDKTGTLLETVLIYFALLLCHDFTGNC